MKNLLLVTLFASVAITGCTLNLDLGDPGNLRTYFEVDQTREQCVERVGIPPNLENPKAFLAEDLRVMQDDNSSDRKKAAALGSLLFGFDSTAMESIGSASGMISDVVSVLDGNQDQNGQNGGSNNADVQVAARGLGLILALAPSMATGAATSAAPACPERRNLAQGFELDFTGCDASDGQDGVLKFEGRPALVAMAEHALNHGGIPGDITAETGDITVTAVDLQVVGDEEVDCSDPAAPCVRTITSFNIINGTVTLAGTDLTVGMAFHKQVDTRSGDEWWEVDGADIRGALSLATDLVVWRLDNQPGAARVKEASISGSVDVSADLNLRSSADSLSVELSELVLKAQGVKVESFNDPVATLEFTGEISGSADWQESRASDRYQGSGSIPSGVEDKESLSLDLGLFDGEIKLSTDKGSLALDLLLAGTATHQGTRTWQDVDQFVREQSFALDLPCETAVLSVNSRELGQAAVELKMYATVNQESSETRSDSQSKWSESTVGDRIRVEATMGDLSASMLLPKIEQTITEKNNSANGAKFRTDTVAIQKAYVAGKGSRDFYFETDPSLQDIENNNARESTGRIVFTGVDEVVLEGDNSPEGGSRVFLNGTEIK